MFNKLKPVYVKVIGDALLPLLGYFLWNWSVYFILLFYILDVVVGEVLVHLKTKKIQAYSEKVPIAAWIKFAGIATFLLICVLVGMHVSMKVIDPSIEFGTEIYLFLSYEEMGIAQGYVLLPLIVFMGYAQYRNEFLLPRKFQSIEFSSLWREHIVSRVLICVLIIVLTLVAILVNAPGWLYVCAIVIASSAYQLLLEKRQAIF